MAEELQGFSLTESWRGFSIKQFKKLQTIDQRLEYARARLPRLGRGAAREVFGLGSGKILKIVHKNIGRLQTRNEVEAYTSGKAEPFLAKIFDFDSENYMWQVSEGVKVLADNADLMAKMHPSEMILEDVITGAYKNRSFEEALRHAVEYQNENADQAFGPFNMDRPIALEELNDLDIELFRKAYEATKAGIEDLDRYDHWGMTTDGRLVIADYGLTEEGFRNA